MASFLNYGAAKSGLNLLILKVDLLQFGPKYDSFESQSMLREQNGKLREQTGLCFCSAKRTAVSMLQGTLRMLLLILVKNNIQTYNNHTLLAYSIVEKFIINCDAKIIHQV